MIDHHRHSAKHEALMDELRPVLAERDAALRALAIKQIGAAKGSRPQTPTAEERARFEEAQAAYERVWKRIQALGATAPPRSRRTRGSASAHARKKWMPNINVLTKAQRAELLQRLQEDLQRDDSLGQPT